MDWQSPAFSSRAQQVDEVLAQTAQRTFMARVYRWMFAGLAVTGGVAFYTAGSEELLRIVARGFWFFIIAELAAVVVLSWAAPRLSAAAAGALFMAYAVLNGLTLSLIFLVYQLGSVAQAFFITAAVYGAMSIYGTVTRKDLSAWHTFLFMGLIGVVVAGAVNIFWPSPGLSFVTSCACVVVFSGLTAYDTQKLRALAVTGAYSGQASLPVRGALVLYLDFVNLFLALLRLFGRRR